MKFIIMYLTKEIIYQTASVLRFLWMMGTSRWNHTLSILLPTIPPTLRQRQACRSTSDESGSLSEASVTVNWSRFTTLRHWLSKTSKMAALLVQLIGFMLSALGQFLISAATMMDMWSLQDRSFTVVTNVYTYSGLWNSCVGTAYGTTQCRPYFTILGLPGKRITFLHMLD